ncbi:hypothetical protein K432DRAFT_382704 [Lepidopterella palustris CBS 459.81]|uniref:Uncharacterized protein n=1 Tax=Lepidopterella palustris CBS 459.81 TaxID=1314670 RepID=A0A8E2JEM9_9PEZI|nr:hypothetical protein K432DRAFT_382704 [Lepidopterella palustris CBS 459.81]
MPGYVKKQTDRLKKLSGKISRVTSDKYRRLKNDLRIKSFPLMRSGCGATILFSIFTFDFA